jgi:hypothetical protein
MNKSFTGLTRTSILTGSLAVMLVAGLLLAACSNPLASDLSTPLPAEYLPTAAALTLAELEMNRATATQTLQPVVSPTMTAIPTNAASPTVLKTTQAQPSATTAAPKTATVIATETALATASATAPATPSPQRSPTNFLPSATVTLTPAPVVQTPVEATAPFGATNTPAPPIPDARIQIYRLGELSKVISPIDVSLRLTCGDAKVVRIELHGEDGRLLARDVRTYSKVPWDAARVGMPLDFEISAAAELGRLVISAEDSFGRLIEVNSMNLILLSQGITELNPSSGLQERIIIQDPLEKTLIQGGKLIISGRARPETNQPLRVMLVAEDGRIIGQRLAGVTILVPGDYGTFMAEVPYSVTDVTPALLTVFEEGDTISENSFLTSINVILAP